jgi:hypothetical protein
MQLQRRYSVTGQTPPGDVGVSNMKSPKLQALDTSVQTTCGLCEAQGETCAGPAAAELHPDGGGQERGRKTANHAIVRTSSKRSATQLPSPSSPSQELPIKKLNCLGLGHHIERERDAETDIDMDMSLDMDEGSLTDPCPEESDWALSSYGDSSSASFPSSPELSSTSVTDDTLDEGICLDEPALPYSNSNRVEPSDSNRVELAISSPQSSSAPTLLTLPPELRHQIYRHLPDLVLSHPLIYCLSTFANNMQHPLASVSHLIRTEALAIFYSYNTWIIKLEFKIMYDAFQDWIIRLGDGANHLRIVTIAVRGAMFKPRTSHSVNSIGLNGVMNTQIGAVRESYCPPDGDASFRIDLSEKWTGGRVVVERNDGTQEAGERARVLLEKLTHGLWEKRRLGQLNGQDWVDVVDSFLGFTGWW